MHLTVFLSVHIVMEWFSLGIQLLIQLHPFNGLYSRTTWVSQYQKGKTSLDLNEVRDYGVFGCSGIGWTNQQC